MISYLSAYAGPLPLFFVSVASKGLRLAVSGLVKKNREELPAATNPGEDLLNDNPAGKEKARILLLARSGSLVSRGEFPVAHRTMGRIS